MNEDGELSGRLCETTRTYTNLLDDLTVSVLEEQNAEESNNCSSSKEETSLSTNVIEKNSLSEGRDLTICADVPIGLSPKILQTRYLNDHGESSPSHSHLTPHIVVTETRPNEAIHPGQAPVHTEEDDEKSLDEAIEPGRETINKPYLQNPILLHCGENRDMRFLVWMSGADVEFQMSGWLKLYWEQRDVLEKASQLTASKASLPKSEKRTRRGLGC